MEPKQLIEDVIEEVLLRLPPRSILRFQSTCRLFDRIIRAPYFVSAHTQRCRSSSFNTTDVVLFNEEIPQHCVTINNLTSVTSEMILSIPQELHHPDLIFSLQDVCDGLMCFIRESRYSDDGNEALRKIIVFNPFTRNCFVVNLPVLESIIVVVFYNNEQSRNYKVLLRININGVLYLRLYTLGDSTMKEIVNPTPYDPVHCSIGRVVMKGNYYCFGTEIDDNLNNAALLVFNLETEVVSSLKLPAGFKYEENLSRLFVVEEKLCIYNILYTEGRVDMWVLVDCREEIWIKKQVVNIEVVGTSDDGRNYIAITYYYPFFILVDSDCKDVALPDREFNFYFLWTDLPELPGRPLEPDILVDYFFFHFTETLALVPVPGIN